MELLLKIVFGIIFDAVSAVVLMWAMGQWHEAAAGIPALGFMACFAMVIALDVIITGILVSNGLGD